MISNRNDTSSESATTTASNDPMQSQSSHATAGADSPICVTLGAEPTQVGWLACWLAGCLLLVVNL